jgi:hypothetical protein
MHGMGRVGIELQRHHAAQQRAMPGDRGAGLRPDEHRRKPGRPLPHLCHESGEPGRIEPLRRDEHLRRRKARVQGRRQRAEQGKERRRRGVAGIAAGEIDRIERGEIRDQRSKVGLFGGHVGRLGIVAQQRIIERHLQPQAWAARAVAKIASRAGTGASGDAAASSDTGATSCTRLAPISARSSTWRASIAGVQASKLLFLARMPIWSPRIARAGALWIGPWSAR